MAKLPALTEDQEAFGRLARDILRALDLVTAEEFQGQENDEETSDEQENSEGGDAETEPGEEGSEGQERPKESERDDGETG
ncbi:hypothetical protein ABTK90_19480, partial [Acinetobacter baumannii]